MKLVGLVVLAAAFATAVGVLVRAVRTIMRLLRDIDRRVRKLSRLTDPDDDDSHP